MEASPRKVERLPEATGVSPETVVCSSRLAVTDSVWVGQPSASSVVSERSISSVPSAPTETPGPSPGWQAPGLEVEYVQETDIEPGNGRTGNGRLKSTGTGPSSPPPGSPPSPGSEPDSQSPPTIVQTASWAAPATVGARPVANSATNTSAITARMPAYSEEACPDASRSTPRRYGGPHRPSMGRWAQLPRGTGPGPGGVYRFLRFGVQVR